MIKPIMKDPLFLSQKSQPATRADAHVMIDLADTLRANLDRCVGMAANMIGVRKRIIAVALGPALLIMVNPKIVKKSGEYEAEEGCLSLSGRRKARRYKNIDVEYMDTAFARRRTQFSDYVAQIIQHELDHCDGILI